MTRTLQCTTNAAAAGLWGVDALGLSPRQLTWWRTAFAASTGIRARERCATTAIAASGLCDPAVSITLRILDAFQEPLCLRLLDASKAQIFGFIYDEDHLSTRF